jgi:hypothetical protein
MIFKQNKYTICYYSIINRSMSRSISGYTEKHHIIPKSLGGSDSPENLAILTAKEHYIVHLLLPYMVSEPTHKRKMWGALRCMSKMVSPTHTRYVGSARFYEKAKENTDFGHMRGKKHSEESKKKMSKSQKGHMISEETKKKIGLANSKYTGRTPWNKGITLGPQTTEQRLKKSLALTGKKKSQETRSNMKSAQSLRSKDSYAQPGWKHDEHALEKIREYARNRPRLTCPHCGKEGTVPGMKRYHFDNCKVASASSKAS